MDCIMVDGSTIINPLKNEKDGDLPFDTRKNIKFYHLPSIICLRPPLPRSTAKSPPWPRFESTGCPN